MPFPSNWLKTLSVKHCALKFKMGLGQNCKVNFDKTRLCILALLYAPLTLELHHFHFVEPEKSVEECQQIVEEQLKLPEGARDVPKLLKIWGQKAFFQRRRESIAKLPAGQVQELIEKFPLLNNIVFVCMHLFTVINILLKN